MESNPFKKIVAGLATVAALSNTSAQEAVVKQAVSEDASSHTREMSIEATKLIQAIDVFEKKFASGKEVRTLTVPTIAIYSANDLLNETSFSSAPEYNSNFWASTLEVELVDNDKSHGYLERSPDGVAGIERENLLQYDGIIDEENSKTRAYVKPDQYLIVSVNQVEKVIVVSLCDSKIQAVNSSISVLIENDLDATQKRLTQKVNEMIGK